MNYQQTLESCYAGLQLFWKSVPMFSVCNREGTIAKIQSCGWYFECNQDHPSRFSRDSPDFRGSVPRKLRCRPGRQYVQFLCCVPLQSRVSPSVVGSTKFASNMMNLSGQQVPDLARSTIHSCSATSRSAALHSANAQPFTARPIHRSEFPLTRFSGPPLTQPTQTAGQIMKKSAINFMLSLIFLFEK